MRRDHFRRVLLPVMVAAVCWPLIELAGGVLMARHHPFEVVVLRYVAHLSILVPVALLWSGRDVFRTRRPVLQLARGFCMFLMPVFFIMAVAHGSGRFIWTVFWSMPFLVLAGAVLLGARPRLTAWGVGVATVGGAWLLRDAPMGGVVAALLGIGTAASFAGYVVLSRVLREERLTTSLVYTAVGALVPMALVVVPLWTAPTSADILPVVGLGVFSLLILGGLDLALESEELAGVVPWLATVPILEVLVGAGLGHGLPDRSQIVGSAVIGLAMAAWLVREYRRPAPAAASLGDVHSGAGAAPASGRGR